MRHITPDPFRRHCAEKKSDSLAQQRWQSGGLTLRRFLSEVNTFPQNLVPLVRKFDLPQAQYARPAPGKLSDKLRLQDARGTTATRLLNAGLCFPQIASFMGWRLRHAQNVIEHYARLAPDESDRILKALIVAKQGVA
ncbi:hypothetical protein [Gemmobacter sp.]|uniref:hypothetical protein n=1 Tax=Gemmobacter sp. TaxID=1898957 RepID=UPI0025BF441C|nr:hypothetical protein [Gemmobacter sp.]